ncbi:MAG: glycerophosphodiester phosphodiesterase family protein [Patescibacteria group bacterium]|jgi:glycerophosphoryl diester phosphodiesterase
MIILGHRGMPNRRVAENTIMSFTRAVQAGVDGIEFDVRLSRDGELVIFHDDNLTRVAGDARKIHDLTAKELSEVELRGAGSIPTLNEVIPAVPTPLLLNFEIKDVEAAPLVFAKLKTSAALRERAIISSFHLDVVKACKDELPDVKRVALLHSWVTPVRRRTVWPLVFETEPTAIGTRIGSLNASRVRWLKARGYQVAAYEDRPSIRAARRMAKLEVDIAMTFRPDAILKLETEN